MKDRTVKNDLAKRDVRGRPNEGSGKARTMKPITTPQMERATGDSSRSVEACLPDRHGGACPQRMARLEQNKGALSEVEYTEAKRNILKAYSCFGIKQEGKDADENASF